MTTSFLLDTLQSHRTVFVIRVEKLFITTKELAIK